MSPALVLILATNAALVCFLGGAIVADLVRQYRRKPGR